MAANIISGDTNGEVGDIINEVGDINGKVGDISGRSNDLKTYSNFVETSDVAANINLVSTKLKEVRKNRLAGLSLLGDLEHFRSKVS